MNKVHFTLWLKVKEVVDFPKVVVLHDSRVLTKATGFRKKFGSNINKNPNYG